MLYKASWEIFVRTYLESLGMLNMMSKSNRREMIDLFFLDGEVTLQRMLLNLIKTNQGSILSALKN